MHPTLFALKRAYQAARHVLEVELQSTGLTVAQMDVLKLTLEAPATGLDQRALQADLGVTSATLARLLGAMERKNLIVRAPHSTDARGKTVRPTAKAGRLLEKLIESREAEYTARLLRGFTKAETNTLTTLLRRIADNMGGADRVDNKPYR
jgi:DNA-binding MarR family transcriptional regulator